MEVTEAKEGVRLRIGRMQAAGLSAKMAGEGGVSDQGTRRVTGPNNKETGNRASDPRKPCNTAVLHVVPKVRADPVREPRALPFWAQASNWCRPLRNSIFSVKREIRRKNARRRRNDRLKLASAGSRGCHRPWHGGGPWALGWQPETKAGFLRVSPSTAVALPLEHSKPNLVNSSTPSEGERGGKNKRSKGGGRRRRGRRSRRRMECCAGGFFSLLHSV